MLLGLAPRALVALLLAGFFWCGSTMYGRARTPPTHRHGPSVLVGSQGLQHGEAARGSAAPAEAQDHIQGGPREHARTLLTPGPAAITSAPGLEPYVPMEPALTYPPPQLRDAYEAALRLPPGSSLGCWRDRRILRDLDESITFFPRPLSADVCLTHCEGRGTLFAGVSRGVECWCGDAPMNNGRLEPTECDGRDAFAYMLLRTRLRHPRAATSPVAISGMCALGFSCTQIFLAVVGGYAARHHLDLFVSSSSIEPTLPTAFAKLGQMQRLLRMGYAWIWWLDCDTVLLRPEMPPLSILRALADPSIGGSGFDIGLSGAGGGAAEGRGGARGEGVSGGGAGPGVGGGASSSTHSEGGRRDDAGGAVRSPSLIVGWEVWGWINQSHPLNTGSFFLRGSAGADSPRLLHEWTEHSLRYKQHPLWEQQGLSDLLSAEKVPGGARTPRWLRNGSILAFGAPPFNTLLCPTSRSLALPPVVLHLTRGEAALGRCAAESLPRWMRRVTQAFRSQDWKGVILARILTEGLQEVRDECCTGHRFGPKLFKRHWGGYIDTVSVSDRYPARLGVREEAGGPSVREIASRLSVCGSPGHNVSLRPHIACDLNGAWLRGWADAPRQGRLRKASERVAPHTAVGELVD